MRQAAWVDKSPAHLMGGLAGLWRRCLVQMVYAIGAAPIGRPGWPDLAFSTISTASKRMVFTQRVSIFLVSLVFIKSFI